MVFHCTIEIESLKKRVIYLSRILQILAVNLGVSPPPKKNDVWILIGTCANCTLPTPPKKVWGSHPGTSSLQGKLQGVVFSSEKRQFSGADLTELYETMRAVKIWTELGLCVFFPPSL